QAPFFRKALRDGLRRERVTVSRNEDAQDLFAQRRPDSYGHCCVLPSGFRLISLRGLSVQHLVSQVVANGRLQVADRVLLAGEEHPRPDVELRSRTEELQHVGSVSCHAFLPLVTES